MGAVNSLEIVLSHTIPALHLKSANLEEKTVNTAINLYN